MKKCSKCGEVKSLEEFNKNKSKKDGLDSKCRACKKQYYQANREKALERQKQYRESNRKKIAESDKRYRKANREKIAEQKKQYYEANHEKVLERVKQYHQDNREKRLEQQKQYRKDNREKIKQYYQENRELYKVYSQKRRALKRNAAGNATAADIQARFDYHGNRCYYCGCDGKMQIEHRIPLSRGGTHHPANIVPACQSCNLSKATKTEKEFKFTR